MITVNDTNYRNLQEQVLKNKEDITTILETNGLLSDFGIKIVGSVETIDELPDPKVYTGYYGDAYTVGTQVPYNFYIFTRPNEATGEAEPRWFYIGQFPLPGPQGPQGPKGPQGDKGDATLWYYTIKPVSDLGNDGDFAFTADGSIYVKTKGTWTLSTKIVGSRGPQGEQGLKGDKGDKGEQGPRGPQGIKGAASQIIGKVATKDQLPSPLVLNNVYYSYLVGSTDPYDVYVQVGLTPETATWSKVSTFNYDSIVDFVNNISDGKVWLSSSGEKGFRSLIQGPDESKYTTSNNFEFESSTAGSATIPYEQLLGNYASAFGGYSAATGERSFAVGNTTWAAGNYSFASGNKTKAQGANSHTEGDETVASGDNSHSEGFGTSASGWISHAEGYNTKAVGSYTHAEGYKTTAQYNASHAEGCETKVTYQYGHAEGYLTTASSQAAHAEGYNTTASGWISHAEGNGTTASGTNAHAEGQSTFATGNCSHAEGQNTRATSLAAHASGIDTVAQHTASAAMGKGTKTSSMYQLACGSYNDTTTSDLFSVGNGQSEYNRSTAFAVKNNSTPTIRLGKTELTESQLQALLRLLQ